MSNVPWYEVPANRNALARWLDDRSEFTNCSDVIYFYEKPWRWDREWQEYQTERAESRQPANRQLETA